MASIIIHIELEIADYNAERSMEKASWRGDA
jgi:hypothetical protein